MLRATVPASVANLGPGFDCLGLAVDLTNEITVEPGTKPAVEIRGEGAGELPRDASNLAVRAMSRLAREAGRSLPPFKMVCENHIPVQRGLGSSAAAVVAGLLLADRLLQTNLDLEHLLEVAADLEGHPDNVAACLGGGLTVAYRSQRGWRSERLRPHPSLTPVLFIPLEHRLPTDEAREVLSQQVSRSDATFNLARVALGVLALTERPHLLREALEDRLHQETRLSLVPAVRAVYDDLRQAGIPACLAGAGPSLLAFSPPSDPLPEPGPKWRVIRSAVRLQGALVDELDRSDPEWLGGGER
jgi:homoserine kinase